MLDPFDPKTTLSRLKVDNFEPQEVQLSQRDRACFCHKSHSRSLKVIRNDTVKYGVC